MPNWASAEAQFIPNCSLAAPQIFQIFSNFPLHTSVWLGLRSGAAKVRQSRCVRPPESSSSSSTQYRIEIVLWNWFCSRLDLRPRQKQNGKKDKYTNTKTNTLHCALCSRLTRERLLSDSCKIKTIVIEISNERFGCSTGRNTNTVGVLNGKKELARSEFKIWPRNFFNFFPNYPPPDQSCKNVPTVPTSRWC